MSVYSIEPADPVEAFERWKAEKLAEESRFRSELIAALERADEELHAVQMRRDRLAAALRQLDAPGTPEPGVDDGAEEGPTLVGSTTIEAIVMSVGRFPNGATADDVHRYAKAHGKEITRKYLHTYLHRLLGDGRLTSPGEREGRRVYLLGSTAKEGAMSE